MNYRACFVPLLIICFLGIFGCKSQNTSKSSSDVAFKNHKTLGNALDQADAENKLVFVDFYTDWCLPCQIMEEEVYSQMNVSNYLNKNFISYKVNAEKLNGPDLSALYQVKSFPTLLFMDTRGRVIERIEGSVTGSHLIQTGNLALANYQVN